MRVQVPSPAATVVVLREAAGGDPFEVFLVRRHDRAAFMAGAWVFPGGRVDPADAIADVAAWCDGADGSLATFPDLNGADAVSFHLAAVRELFEEAGILLARDASGGFVALAGEAQDRFDAHRRALHAGERSLRDIATEAGLRLALDALVPLAHWVTPAVEIETRRFDARFFLTRLPARQTPLHDTTESTDSAWLSPRQALARNRAGELFLPPPTWRTLHDLAGHESIADALRWAPRRPIRRLEPRVLDWEGETLLVLPGDPLWPAPAVEALDGVTRFRLKAGRWTAG
jgi:8-oxo-dGTP pyrophosphatase MutT (NUDIX family)